MSAWLLACYDRQSMIHSIVDQVSLDQPLIHSAANQSRSLIKYNMSPIILRGFHLNMSFINALPYCIKTNL